MEDILEEKIINEFKYMYNISDEENIIKIIFLKEMIYNLSNSIDNINLINYICRELKFPQDKDIILNDTIISKTYYGSDSSLESIIDNWKFRVLDKLLININNEKKSIYEILVDKYKHYLRYAKKKLKGYSKNTNYTNALKYIMFLELYKDFNIYEINEPRLIQGFKYNEDFYNKLSLDLKYKDSFNNISLLKNDNEKLLEDFIYFNYHKVTNRKLFNEIEITNRQVKVKNGIIDLLGKDLNGNIVIIELKVVSRPIDLIYQYKAYTKSIKESYKTDKVRFIAITPKLSKDIFNEILSEEIELWNYKKNNKNFIFNKII